jgi:hypothetical protein
MTDISDERYPHAITHLHSDTTAILDLDQVPIPEAAKVFPGPSKIQGFEAKGEQVTSRRLSFPGGRQRAPAGEGR